MAKPNLPTDGGYKTIQLAPARIALARTVDASISSSTEVTLNGATTFVRVYAIDQDVYLKWGTSDVTASNFDEVIPAGQIVDLVLPNQADGTRYTALNVIERVSGATVIIIEK